jgi:hypothetical protein
VLAMVTLAALALLGLWAALLLPADTSRHSGTAELSPATGTPP